MKTTRTAIAVALLATVSCGQAVEEPGIGDSVTPMGVPSLAKAAAGGPADDASDLELNRYFSNDMVLQRDKALKIWGSAEEGESISVAFAGQTETTTADQDGRWAVTLEPIRARASPQVLEVRSADSSIALTNIVVGDVFLFARQSSIDVSLGTSPKGKRAAAAVAANKQYRFVKIKTSPSRTALENLKPDATPGWRVVDNRTAMSMSAAAFYLGRDLAKEVDVPIGIVDLDMGYHFPGAWLSDEGLKLARSIPGAGAEFLKKECEYLARDIEAWDKGISDYVRDYENPHHPPKPYEGPLRGMSPIEMPHSPSVCYNAVIYPLRGVALKGMLLHLGNDYPWVLFRRLRKLRKITDRNEINKANQQSYSIFKVANRMAPQVLPAAADDLRRSLGDASLPMAWIMPPGSDKYEYAAHNRDVREIQRRVQAASNAIDLILPGDSNIRMSGQPGDEALLASRCRQWVSGTFYNGKGPASGPLFERFEFRNGVGTIHFKSGTARGLSAEDDALRHFEAAAEDGKFFPCSARLEGSTIKLKCDAAPRMSYVRYGWKRKPVQGLVNTAGLPALPFNTDPKWKYEYWPDLAPVERSTEQHITADIAIVNTTHTHKPHEKDTSKDERNSLIALVADATMLNHGRGPAMYPEAQWQRWRLTAIEIPGHAPRGWNKPDYDDSRWDKVILPASWPWGHVGLLRTKFEVEDVHAYESLEIRSGIYKIRNFKVFLNGHLVARVDVVGRSFGVSAPLTPYAMKLLRNGTNHLAVIADHGRRHVGFGFRLLGRLKDNQKTVRNKDR